MAQAKAGFKTKAGSTNLSKIIRYENFDDYESGTKLSTLPGFSACANTSVVDKLGYAGGGKSLRTWIAAGDEGWGRFGFEYTAIPKGVSTGSTIWWRQAFWVPADFNFRTNSGSLKWFRIGRRTIQGDKNRGCTELQLKADGNWRSLVEYDHDQWTNFDGAKMPRGTWAMYEKSVFFHPTEGSITLWKDGKLVKKQTGINTIGSGVNTAQVTRLLFSTYFNGGSPKTQEAYTDEFALAIDGGGRKDSVFLDTDAQGNKFIGMATADQTLPPPIDPDPPIDPPPIIDPEPPVEPPVEPPGVIEDAITLAHGKTVVHIREDEVLITSDKPIIQG